MASGIKYIRTEVMVYRGHPIFLLKVIDKTSKFISKHKTFDYYGVCVKDGNLRLAKDRYKNIYCRIDQAKDMIDNIENGKVYLTEREYTNWVSRPNRKHSFSFTKERLTSIWRAYPKANEKRKVAYIERLHDANFHSEALAIEDGDLKAFNECLKELLG